MARKEQEVAKTRIHLARMLSLSGRFEEAARQARRCLSYREENGYRVPEELSQLLSADWFSKVVAAGSVRELPKMESKARALLLDLGRVNLRYVAGVVDHINEGKALSYVAIGVCDGVALYHRQFPGVAELAPGTIIELGFPEDDNRVADWRPSDAHEIPGLCGVLKGRLERKEGQDFAFVRTRGSDCFVPPPLARHFTAGQPHEVCCLAVMGTNKKGGTGWRAVRLLNEIETALPN